MSLNTASGARICPECGTRNSGLSLFCAECGASLSNARSANTENEEQTITTFRPAGSGSKSQASSWSDTRDPHETQEFRAQSPMPDAPAGSAAADWDGLRDGGTYTRTPRESRRGFVLGIFAAILIALVIAFFLWSTVAEQSFRDAVTGLFG